MYIYAEGWHYASTASLIAWLEWYTAWQSLPRQMDNRGPDLKNYHEQGYIWGK